MPNPFAPHAETQSDNIGRDADDESHEYLSLSNYIVNISVPSSQSSIDHITSRSAKRLSIETSLPPPRSSEASHALPRSAEVHRSR
jgi:hypothetical protein